MEVDAAKDVKQQVQAIKKVINCLKQGTIEEHEAHAIISLMLVPMFLDTPNKSPLKRLLISCMQSLESKYADVIFDSMKKAVTITMSKTENSIDERRQFVSNCLSMQDNFPIGEKVFMAISKQALVYLVNSFEVFTNEARNKTSPEDLSFLSQSSLAAVQVMNKMLHKSRDLYSGSEVSPSLHKGFKLCARSVTSDLDTLDLRSNCAMTMVLILKIMCPKAVVSKITECLVNAGRLTDDKGTSENAGQYHISFKNIKDVSVIIWLNAALAMLDASHFLESVEKETLDVLYGAQDMECMLCTNDSGICIFVTSVVANILLECSTSVTEVDIKLMTSRALLLLTSKICETLQNAEDPPPNIEHLRCDMNEQSELTSRLIGYSWEHWEDPTDCIRHQARTIFQNTLKIHSAMPTEDGVDDKFMRELCTRLLSMGAQQKGRYGPLCCMVEQLGAQALLYMQPQLPRDLLHCMGEQALASHASELFNCMFIANKREFYEASTDCHKDLCDFYALWIDPVLEVICSGSQLQRTFTGEYILTKILKNEPHCLPYIMKKLSRTSEIQGDALGGMMACLKRAKSIGIFQLLRKNCFASLSNSLDESEALWCGVVPMQLLNQALSHQSDQMRLDAYGLICENQKHTEPLTQPDLHLCQRFMEVNLNNQSAPFRQTFIAATKKLFSRIRDSSNVLMKQRDTLRKKNRDCSEELAILDAYQVFLRRLLSVLFQRISPDSAFAARTCALTMLHLITQVLDKNELLDLTVLATPERVHTLLHCLTDKFEDNNLEAFGILRTLVPQLASEVVLKEEEISELYNAGMQLVCSTRPQDGTTAAYLFKFLLQLPLTREVQLKMDQTDMKSGNDPNSLEKRCLIAVRQLLKELKSELVTSKSSLLHAAATKPMYPVLHCIRYLLNSVTLRDVTITDDWRELLADVITTCFDVAEVVSPVVSHCSPEGNVPQDGIMGPGLAIESVSSGEIGDMQQSANKVNLMPEYLVVCCWRSIKEVSLLLGQLSQSAPIAAAAETKASGMLSMDQVKAIGDYFTRQLLESRHRGAFELAYAGFVKMTETLWNSSISDAQGLPQYWLETIVHDIVSDGDKPRLCATRRSAGVPFYVQAVVSTEPPANQRASLKWVMSQLLPLAHPTGPINEQENIPQVHALNILRTLYRDTRLGEAIYPFIAEGFRAAIVGYNSAFWTIRNSATLLFSSLMTRTFGVKRSKDEASKKNCMTGRVFFSKLPSLYEFLLDRISEAAKEISHSAERTPLQPGLYPVLMVLSRLLPSAIDDQDAFSLAAFIPHVIQCAGSAVLKTRLMAARALRPLVTKTSLASTLSILLLDIIPHASDHHIPFNYVHGVLLQVQHLLHDITNEPPSIITEVVSVMLSNWTQLKRYTDRLSSCWLVKKTAFQILFRVRNIEINKGENGAEKQELRKYIVEEMDHIFHFQSQEEEEKLDVDADNLNGLETQPGYVEFMKELAADYLNYLLGSDSYSANSKEHHLVALLKSPLYEVQLIVLERMCVLLDSSYVSDDMAYSEEIVYTDRVSRETLITIKSSCVIFETLIWCIGGNSSHSECLALALEVLYLLDDTLYKTLQHFFNVPQFLKLLDLNSSNIRNISLQVLGKFVASLDSVESLKSLPQNEGEQNTVTVSKTNENTNESDDVIVLDSENDDVLELLMTSLEERSSVLESVESRLACARFLAHNSYNFLLAKALSGDFVLRAWTVLFRLLQDEHDDVRKTMATLISHVSTPTSEAAVHADLALDAALDVFSRHLLPWHPLQTLDTLLLWVELELESEIEGQDKEVRLFDKGEMNTYKDELVFIQTVANHLEGLLDMIFSTKTTLNQADTTGLKSDTFSQSLCQITPQTKQELLTFLANRHCSVGEEVSSRLSWINASRTDDIFLKQAENQTDCMYILRRVVVLRLLFTVLKKYAHIYEQPLALADAQFWADKMQDLINEKFAEGRFDETFSCEIRRFFVGID